MAGVAVDRRDQVVAVATRLFSKQGFAATSLDDVAAEIGFTKAAIYYWFENKDEILFSIHDQIVSEAMARVRAIRAGGGTARDQLDAVITQHVQTLLANVEANTVFDRERHALSVGRQRSINRRDGEYERALREIYAEGVGDGTLRDIDPELAVGALLGAVNWTYRWFRGRSPRRIGEVTSALVDFVEHGVVPLDA